MRGESLIRLIGRRTFTRYNNAISGKPTKRTAKQKHDDRLNMATEIIKAMCG